MARRSESAGLPPTDQESRFYDGLAELYEAAGRPSPQFLVAQSELPGNSSLKESSLNEWLSRRKAVPRDTPAFNFLIAFLHGRATARNRRPQPVGYYKDLRRAAARARDEARAQARGKDLERRSAEPSSMLKAYARAAGVLCSRHPAPGLGRLGLVPELPEVYQSQRGVLVVGRAGGPAEQEGLFTDGDLLDPADVLRGGTRVIVAGPGGGKSSLLREVLRAGLDLGPPDRPVPVLVPASALTSEAPLAQDLERHVRKELGIAWEALPEGPGFFERPPRPGSAWLVLVDALDEVIDSEPRRRVLEKIRHVLRSDDFVHEFIVATRPLTDSELAVLGPRVPHLGLEPFDAAGLRGFVRKWGAAQGVADPDEHATVMARALEQSGIARLARIPLTATMLCLLYGADPQRSAARSRGQLYRQFLDLLHERQFQGGLRKRVHAALEHVGGDLADRTIETLPRLVEALVWEHLSGVPGLVAGMVKRLKPGLVQEAVWDEVTRDLLCSTGLVSLRAGEPTFLHQTIVEYLYVRSVGERPAGLRRALRSELRVGGRWPGPRVVRRIVFEWRDWHVPEDRDSSIGFMLDRARDLDIDCTPMLRRMVKLGGVAGSAFVMRQHVLGTHVPSEILAMALDRLVQASRRRRTLGVERILAVESLLISGDPRGEQALSDICEDPMGLRLPDYFEPILVLTSPDGAVEDTSDWEERERKRFLRRQRQRIVWAFTRISANRDLPDHVRALAATAQATYQRLTEDAGDMESR
ncbi:NACHT domain-containing protein [Streptomyces sp. NPDC005017]|uniref:NACHT domain-containing protein n=1 Tax=Streptomyces sp. NPDC005017 TaxID=3364706 RepID=UPI0036959B08